MKKHILFTISMVVLLFLIMGNYSYGNDIKLTELKNIPDNEFAACKVKSNDFWFLCHLNKKNFSSCKFAIGSKFTLPKCRPVDCVNQEPIRADPATIKPSPANPFLDALRKAGKY